MARNWASYTERQKESTPPRDAPVIPEAEPRGGEATKKLAVANEQGAGRSVPSPVAPEARHQDVGEGQGGGESQTSEVGSPLPLTPPHVMSKTCLRHDGEGNPVAAVTRDRSIRRGWAPPMTNYPG